jgi:chloramphenicol-sensitive protein RarD
MSSERLGILAGVAAYLLWGLLTVYWKALSGLNPFDLIGWRVILALVFLAALLAYRRRLVAVLALRHQPRLLGRLAVAALLLTANWTAYVWAVTHDNVVETALGYFMAPIGTMLLGVFVLHERLRRAQQVALGLAATSVVVLTVAYGRVPWFALVLASTWSVYGYLKKTVPLGSVESLAGETAVLLLPAVALVVAMESAGQGVLSLATPLQLVLVLGLGVITATPLLLFAYAAPRVPLSTLGPLQYLVPTINFLLGVLVYGESMTPARAAGFGLVWVALALFTVDTVRAARLGSVPPRPAVAAAASR